MKNKFIKTMALLFVVVTFSSCDNEQIFFEGNGNASLAFASTTYNLSIPQENLNLQIPVDVTISSEMARTFNVSVVQDVTTGEAAEYSVGTITIPAGEFNGFLSVDFNFANITGADGDTKNLVLDIVSNEEVFAYRERVTITYFREIICNDLELEIISDIYAGETTFDIKDSNGNVVAGGQGIAIFPVPASCTQQSYTETITLPDGDYVFTIYDEFGDGQSGTNAGCSGGAVITGSYSLTCSIIVHASGSGDGSADSTSFSVNP